jgi:GAF domain-containing protein
MNRSAPADPEQALVELARIDLGRESVASVLQRIAGLAKTVLAADDVSVTLRAEGRPSTVACTGELALGLDERQYEFGYGPCLDAAEGGEPVDVVDAARETRWPAYMRAAVGQGLGSSLSVPVPVQAPVAAAINSYATRPYAFDDASHERAGVLASYAAVAIDNMHLLATTRQRAEQLQQAMESRAVIEQAKGILMGERRCSASEAFVILTGLSQQSNRKVRDVAQALVDNAQHPSRG